MRLLCIIGTTQVLFLCPSGVPDFSATDLNYISSVMKQMGGLGVRTVLYDSSTQRVLHLLVLLSKVL